MLLYLGFVALVLFVENEETVADTVAYQAAVRLV